jgi:hypothetical protein
MEIKPGMQQPAGPAPKGQEKVKSSGDFPPDCLFGSDTAKSKGDDGFNMAS